MQITIELDDDLAQEFFAITPKDEQTSVIKSMIIEYLKSKTAKETETIIREGDDEVYGMWADRDIDAVDYVRELRKGRQF